MPRKRPGRIYDWLPEWAPGNDVKKQKAFTRAIIELHFRDFVVPQLNRDSDAYDRAPDPNGHQKPIKARRGPRGRTREYHYAAIARDLLLEVRATFRKYYQRVQRVEKRGEKPTAEQIVEVMLWSNARLMPDEVRRMLRSNGRSKAPAGRRPKRGIRPPSGWEKYR